MTEKVFTQEEQTIKALREARALIDEPSKWIKGDLARSKFGNTCETSSQNAVCFCSVGALMRVTGHLFGPEWRALSSTFGNRPVAAWNDDSATTHKDVLAAFDRAIADLEMFA